MFTKWKLFFTILKNSGSQHMRSLSTPHLLAYRYCSQKAGSSVVGFYRELNVTIQNTGLFSLPTESIEGILFSKIQGTTSISPNKDKEIIERA